MNTPQPQSEAEDKGLLKSSGVVSVMTLFSRVLGLVRDMVIANFFGAGSGADTFILAFRIPNFFRRLFGEGAFSQAFVPVFSEYRNRGNPAETRALISSVSGSLGFCLLIISVLGVLCAPVVIAVFAAGYVYGGEIEKLALASEMLRITFPYVLLICMTALAGAILNSYGKFAAPAFTPVLLNVCLILAAIYLSPLMESPVVGLAWGVLIAGVVQLTFQLPFLARQRLLVAPKVDFQHAGVKKVMVLMLPALFGVSVGQINLLLDTVLASFLETGSLSWLYYSDRLLELPLALFGIAIATVVLPSLSMLKPNQSDEFSKTIDWALRMVCLFGIPASLALIVLSESLITTLFYQGEMTQRDVQMSALSLSAYGVGLLGHMFVKVLAPGYYARQDMSTPVRYGIIALASNMVLNLLLVWNFKHAGLALATSLSAFLNAGLLFYGLRKQAAYIVQAGWFKLMVQLVVANSLMVGFLIYVSPPQEVWFDMSFWVRLGIMLAVCGSGGMIYGFGLLMVGIRFKEWIR